MRNLLTVVVAVALLLLFTACGATQAQVDDLLDISQQKDVIAVQVATQLDMVCDAGMDAADRNTDAGRRAYDFFDQTKEALSVKTDDYERLTRLQVRMATSLTELPEADRERYILQALDLIAMLKGDKPLPGDTGSGASTTPSP